MSYADNLWLFTTLLFGIIVVPGVDMIFVLANALSGGRRTGFAAVAGVTAGGAVHSLFGAIGVGLLSRLPSAVFTAVLAAGATYMIWIGITLLRSSIAIDGIEAETVRSRWVAFRRGAVTCLLNPKAYLFMVAVYPQFLKPQFGSLWSQALILGVLTAAMQIGVYGALALAAGRSRDALLSSPRLTAFVGRAAGLLLIVAAGLTAWQGWSES